MTNSTAFLDIKRRVASLDEAGERLRHFREFHQALPTAILQEQAERCMGCGTPFCHGAGCPLGNLIPECNALAAQGRWQEACERLHLANNFPEFTGRICPALCEAACVNALDGEAVAIGEIELAIVERGWDEGWIRPRPPARETGKRVAVIGSGPAGLTAAQQLRRAGHAVTVFERADKPGGLLRHGIPDFKLAKRVLDRRLEQLRAEGVRFELRVDAGVDLTAGYFRKKFDAVSLCAGSSVARDLDVPKRDAAGVHLALDFLAQSNRRVAGEAMPPDEEILATDKRVVILGGGDTGSDCMGTALRQGAASVEQLEILPRPPDETSPETPWPLYPKILRTSSSQEEGGHRQWSVRTTAFRTEGGRVTGLECDRVGWTRDPETGRMQMEPVPQTAFTLDADLVLLALGFVHPVHEGLPDGLGVAYDARGNVQVDERMRTSVAGVYAAGDMATGAWLVVGAMAGGRRLAHTVDEDLMGETSLPDCAPMARLGV